MLAGCPAELEDCAVFKDELVIRKTWMPSANQISAVKYQLNSILVVKCSFLYLSICSDFLISNVGSEITQRCVC